MLLGQGYRLDAYPLHVRLLPYTVVALTDYCILDTPHVQTWLMLRTRFMNLSKQTCAVPLYVISQLCCLLAKNVGPWIRMELICRYGSEE